MTSSSLAYSQYILDLSFLLPEIFLVTTILSLVLYASLSGADVKYNFPLQNRSLSWLSVLTLIFTCCLLNNSYLTGVVITIFNGAFVVDYLSVCTKNVIVLASIGCFLISQDYLDRSKLNFFEYYLLVLLSILGLLLLVSSNDLITAYLAIEMQSLSFYVLATFRRDSAFSTEAGLKYFILGAFSSALILLGSTYIYGITGSLNFTEIKVLLQDSTFGELDFDLIFFSLPVLDFLKLVILFVATGLLFKLAAAPFHMWSPDVYEGSPTSSTTIFAIVPKIAVFVLLVRIFHESFYVLIDSWQQMMLFSAVTSVIVGSFVALKQRKLKRLIAYSAISHVGYLLMAFSTGTFEGTQSLFFYMIIYMITGLATWSIVLSIDSVYGSTRNLSDITALGQVNKGVAITFTLILFSLAGIPPLAGFYAKMYVFLVAMSSSFYLAAIVAILSSVISTFYYIRVIKVIYFEEPKGLLFYFPISQLTSLILGLSFFLIILLFLEPHLVTYYTANMISIL
jgi:NADH-quinone oxidoreductase subunit N